MMTTIIALSGEKIYPKMPICLARLDLEDILKSHDSEHARTSGAARTTMRDGDHCRRSTRRHSAINSIRSRSDEKRSKD